MKTQSDAKIQSLEVGDYVYFKILSWYKDAPDSCPYEDKYNRFVCGKVSHVNAEAGAFRFVFEAFRNTSEELILSDLQEWIEFELPEYGKLITFKEYEECEGVTDAQTLSGRENSEDSNTEEEESKIEGPTNGQTGNSRSKRRRPRKLKSKNRQGRRVQRQYPPQG